MITTRQAHRISLQNKLKICSFAQALRTQCRPALSLILIFSELDPLT